MVENSDLFSLENIDDLPESVKKELKAFKRDNFEKKLIELFKLATSELNLDQIQAGYFRLHKEVKDRRQITTKLYNMSKSDRPAIESIEGKKGVYRLKSDFKE